MNVMPGTGKNAFAHEPMPNEQPPIHKFESGAIRSTDAKNVRYDLISHIGLRRLAETYCEGATKYGDYNWLKGMPASDLLNHLIRHVEEWRAGNKDEDHLAHAAWGLFALMHFEETRPDLIDVPPSQESVHAPSQYNPEA